MGMVKEFKEFAMKGNMMDMAVGIIIGAAFGKIVSSVVADVLMPPLGLLLGGVNFASLKAHLERSRWRHCCGHSELRRLSANRCGFRDCGFRDLSYDPRVSTACGRGRKRLQPLLLRPPIKKSCWPRSAICSRIAR